MEACNKFKHCRVAAFLQGVEDLAEELHHQGPRWISDRFRPIPQG
jgi:hypothetical protein